MSAPQAEIASAFIGACLDELEAPKPGNVHVFADGHGSSVADFRRSAEVAAEPIARLRASVGARILGAIEATRAAVGQNTNLGIVLLCAPLARAAELRAARMQGAVAGGFICKSVFQCRHYGLRAGIVPDPALVAGQSNRFLHLPFPRRGPTQAHTHEQ